MSEHSGFALTVLYLLLIAIGLMYEWWLFRHFNVNILYYAEPADFLLVPFREPLVVLVSLAPIPLFALYMRGARWLGRKVSKRQTTASRNMLRAMNVTAVILWSIAFTARYADRVSERIKSGQRPSVTIELAADNGVTPTVIRGPIIGTSGHYVFVFDPRTKQTRVVSNEHIAELVFEPRKRG